MLGGQPALFTEDELRAVALQAPQSPEDKVPLPPASGGHEPAHEDLLDPVVKEFVAFSPKNLPAHDGRKSDVEVLSAFDPIRPYHTQNKIYSALLRSCLDPKAVWIAKGVWRVEISHSDLASAAHCCERSIADAIRNLAAHGYILRHPEKWGGGHSSQYYVRDDRGMTAILLAAGVKFARKVGKGEIKLFGV